MKKKIEIGDLVSWYINGENTMAYLGIVIGRVCAGGDYKVHWLRWPKNADQYFNIHATTTHGCAMIVQYKEHLRKWKKAHGI